VVSLPSSDAYSPRRKNSPARYADDFLIGIIGSKQDAREVMAHVSEFARPAEEGYPQFVAQDHNSVAKQWLSGVRMDTLLCEVGTFGCVLTGGPKDQRPWW
jgi:hypothetical protein